MDLPAGCGLIVNLRDYRSKIGSKSETISVEQLP